jgi:hypothetical protein
MASIALRERFCRKRYGDGVDPPPQRGHVVRTTSQPTEANASVGFFVPAANLPRQGFGRFRESGGVVPRAFSPGVGERSGRERQGA